jgi:hypothetical protein
MAPVASINPPQTHGDWAWAPGIAWGGLSRRCSLSIIPRRRLCLAGRSSRFDLKAVSLRAARRLLWRRMWDVRTSDHLAQDRAVDLAPTRSFTKPFSRTERREPIPTGRHGSRRIQSARSSCG